MTNKNDKWGNFVGILIMISFVFWGIHGLLGWGEREGVVKYDDCREVVTLTPDTWQKLYHTFSCTYSRKTKSGRSMGGGECVRIENDSSLFSTSHTCATAYVYEKDPSGGVCTDPTHPYLTYDDTCSADPQL
ncbi:hypothetical protein KGQ34_04260 [Patescibacteria group bacterium]|nr:hypothetical protein [Patescibacteria group bacterium]